MIKNVFFYVVLACGTAYAKSTCTDIQGQQNYPPLTTSDGTICFIQEPVLDPKTKVQTGADAISLYLIVGENVPVKADGRGLLYDDTPGEIIDAFSSSISPDYRERIFVIHSMNVRESLVESNSSGKFYSVSVFNQTGNSLQRDERASDWFGADYSWLSDGRRIIYKFPYQSKRDVQLAMNSPFARLMGADELIQVKLKEKSYLFDGPNIKSQTKKYLIKGDRATVDKTTAGWCQVTYSSGQKPLEMWAPCNSLDVSTQSKK